MTERGKREREKKGRKNVKIKIEAKRMKEIEKEE